MKKTVSALSRFCRISIALLGLWQGLVLPSAIWAQDAATLTTVHSFDGPLTLGYRSSVTLGGDGNLYGVSDIGGANNGGGVFKVSPDGTVTTLYSFPLGGGDNSYNPLVRGGDGSFYGTSFGGGVKGYGMVYKVSPEGAFTDLYEFTGGPDGYFPATALTLGRDGNFYGTNVGGDNFAGVIFKITSSGAFTILHVFTGDDGDSPYAPLVQARDGSFYGTTDGAYGGGGLGTVFKITPAGEFTDLYHFDANDSDFPEVALVEGNDGNFYGTTTGAGSAEFNTGTVFKVTPEGQFTTLHAFTGGLDGRSPSGLTLGDDGNFYGTTQLGGLYLQDNGFPRAPGPGYGTIFQITPAGVLTTLYSFTGSSTDGRNPAGPLLKSGDGGFYGTTGGDGAAVAGTLFKLTVASHPSFFAGQESFGIGVYDLRFPSGNYFGYYAFLSDPRYLYHFDLGYEYVFDANDDKAGVYLYDFASGTFFYTSPTFPFPYLYDFSLHTVVYYYPDPNNRGRYNTNGTRYFYRFDLGRIFVK